MKNFFKRAEADQKQQVVDDADERKQEANIDYLANALREAYRDVVREQLAVFFPKAKYAEDRADLFTKPAGHRIVIALDDAESIVFDSVPDQNGNVGGFVDIYVGDAQTGAPPWRTFQMGGAGRVAPIPHTARFFTAVPRAGTTGVLITVHTNRALGFGGS